MAHDIYYKFVLGKLKGKCERRKIERENRKKKKKKIKNIIKNNKSFFLYFFKFISHIFLNYIKIINFYLILIVFNFFFIFDDKTKHKKTIFHNFFFLNTF